MLFIKFHVGATNAVSQVPGPRRKRSGGLWGVQMGLQDSPEEPPRASKAPQEASRNPQDASWSPPRSPQHAPKRPLESPTGPKTPPGGSQVRQDTPRRIPEHPKNPPKTSSNRRPTSLQDLPSGLSARGRRQEGVSPLNNSKEFYVWGDFKI